METIKVTKIYNGSLLTNNRKDFLPFTKLMFRIRGHTVPLKPGSLVKYLATYKMGIYYHSESSLQRKRMFAELNYIYSP